MRKDNNNLETDRLVLKSLRSEHAKHLFHMLSDQRIYSFIPQEPPTSVLLLEDRYRRLETGKSPVGDELWLNWAIYLKQQDNYIGTVQATVCDNKSAQIAYELAPDYWRCGYAAEACLRMIEALFADYDVLELIAEVDTRNIASWKLLEKLNFERAMTRIGADYFKGENSDEYTYKLIRNGAT